MCLHEKTLIPERKVVGAVTLRRGVPAGWRGKAGVVMRSRLLRHLALSQPRLFDLSNVDWLRVLA